MVANDMPTDLNAYTNSGFQTVKNFQHVSAGHQPIFGLGVCADWVQPG
jgi:hypothetical protein